MGILPILTLVALPGCASKPEAPAAVPVQGMVSYQGKGVPGILVKFWPRDTELQQLVKPVETASGPDGKFHLDCPPGIYKVTLVAPPLVGGAPLQSGGVAGPPTPTQGQSPVPEDFADRTRTPLEVQVQAGGNPNEILKVE
jgi:hypothetical protein